MWLETLSLAVVAFYLVYRWVVANNDHFKNRGIPYDEPTPFMGSRGDLLLQRISVLDFVVNLYNKSNAKVFGFFENRNPVLMIRDPDLAKQITIKDFDHFVNHRELFGSDDDQDSGNLFASSLFSMRDARWKDMRSTLSPAFTGSKMRLMFQLMNEAAQDAVACLKREPLIDGGIELDAKDYCTRYTNDIIASTAFGLQVNSFKDRENEFYIMGKKLTKFTTLQNLKIFLFAFCSKLMRMLKISVFDKQATQYFMRLVLDAMKYRQQHHIIRPDMINMLMESREMLPSEKSDKPKPSHSREWSDVDIVAQCFVFFFAGFETSATLMSFTVHELMENEDVQAKLYEEVVEVSKNLEGKDLTYEAIMGMKYLDQVVSESLRKWPPAVFTDRQCTKDITYEVDGKPVDIKKGESVWFPIVAIHRDPKYFKNPLKFDPERFNEDNVKNIEPFTYYPFGMGQRICIGSRFALLEAKAVIYYLVRDYVIAASPKSTIPMVLGSAGFQMAPKNGFWLKLKPRN